MQHDRQLIYLFICSTRKNTLTVFKKNNNYNEDFRRRNTHRPTKANDNPTPTTTATIPAFETLSHILQPLRWPPIHHYTSSVTNQRQRQGRTKEKAVSGLYDRVLRLLSLLRRRDWQKLHDKTDRT